MQGTQKTIVIVAVLFVVAGIYLQSNIGLADNGDFTRGIRWFSTGPVGFDVNWPATDTQAYHDRFFHYWLPAWKLEFSTKFWMRSSAQLLWIPGLALNYLLVSPNVLYMVNTGLVAKAALLLFLLLFFTWVSRSDLTRMQKTALCAVPGTALALMFVNTEYLAFLNSFYFDVASYIFLLGFLASLIVLRRQGRTHRTYLLALALLLLLTMAKPSTIYWLAFGLLFTIGLRRLLASRKHLLVYLALVAALTPLCYKITQYPQSVYATGPAYHSLFVGVLMFSQQPAQRLHELGIEDGEKCIGVSEYTELGTACFEAHSSKLSLGNSLLVIAREPAILLRMTRYAADRMQRPTVPELVAHAMDDPVTSLPVGLDLWALIKEVMFPRGYAFLAALVVYGAAFLIALRQQGMIGDLGLVGLLATLATPIEISIQIFADGPIDLMKHLFLANILFDVATIAVLGLATIYLVGLVQARHARAGAQRGPGAG